MDQLLEFVGNHTILAGIWVALVAILIYSSIAGVLSKVKEIGTHDATMMMNKHDAVVLDIRPAAEFKKGHILGAKQLKPEQVNQGDFSALEKSKNKPIIVVCAMGMTAKRTAAQLSKQGFEQVSVLKGGMNAWQTANLPVAK
ncbi:rhodanese-like domain-containing protein [Aestuariibacter halophilus]|uniref:Rhodanese-like domain-containing protein n=1 Tax=Fluctibacter halophilus TaxID=226011 RepID=A0ABS8G9U1_9ALTE|nr:rhodanese-like domain-containing protein [Aestuariibacter halophilus]MCC2617347.1 rhodanese-like domain-containing protein [Aestuariibacter halophilus]